MAISLQIPQTFPTVVHLLHAAAAQNPAGEALVMGNTRLTYRDYLHCVTRFANELLALGSRGERVALIMGNSPEFCIAMYAVHMAGAQVVPLNPLYTASELRPLLEDAAAQVLIYDTANAARDGQLAAELKIPHRFEIGPAARTLSSVDLGVVELAAELPTSAMLATLQFTGGTTGRAKGVEITHGALAINLAQRHAVLPTRPDVERILCVMPLFHCYAIHMCMHNMVHSRGILLILPRYQSAELLAVLAAERATLFGGSPTLFTSLMNYEGFERADFSSLQVTYSGASALSAELLTRWETRTGSPVIEGYGQSETGPVVSFNPLHGIRKPASVGIPLPDTTIEIVDLETGTRQLPSGECGEIRVRGPQMMHGYRDRPEETAETLRHGWLYTGDTGELDADGYLYIRGRKKELIIVAGFNVYPREVEDVLARAPGVSECAVVGVPDHTRGELPVAYIVPQQGVACDLEVVRGVAREHLALYKQPVSIQVVDAVPKTSVGKLDRVALKRMALDSRH